MKVEDLNKAVNGINMDEEMQKNVIKNVKRQAEGSHQSRKIHHWPKTAVAAAAAVVVLGVSAIPVSALVNSLVKERMEEMPEEEITAIVEETQNQTTEADGFSRDYTQSERERMKELYQQYQNGTFPSGEIPHIDREEDAGEYEFCYLTTTSYFYLPGRELTDEELLELIDFTLKRDYAFTQNYEKEYAEEVAREQEEQKQAIAENVESGGITEQEAIEIATERLSGFYGITGEGMELNHYYNEGEPEAHGWYSMPNYCVNWSDIINHQYYYFWISAHDGHLISTHHSFGGIGETRPTAQEAEKLLPELHEQAVTVMEKEVKAAYEKEYVYYLTCEDGTTTMFATFVFEKEDGSAVAVQYCWDGVFVSYEETDLSDYENGEILTWHDGGDEKAATAIFRPI